jgi:hypothetical protein
MLNGSKTYYQKTVPQWNGLINFAWCLDGSKQFYNSNFSDVKGNILAQRYTIKGRNRKEEPA